MDPHSVKNLVIENPSAPLLDALDNAKENAIILPLLEAELERSSARLRRLQEYRNSVASPIYRLQPEIMSNIFFIYAQDADSLYDLRWTRSLLPVCRHWYRIAIDTQRLWSFIEVGPPSSSHMVGRPLYSREDLDAWGVQRIEAQRSRAKL